MDEVYYVDIQETADHNVAFASRCSCAYCRNFRKAFPVQCSEALAVLERFGLTEDADIDTIDYSWNETGDKRVYYAYYSVKGTLSQDGYVLYNGDAKITLFLEDSAETVCPESEMESPFFILEVEAELPWWLEESPDD